MPTSDLLTGTIDLVVETRNWRTTGNIVEQERRERGEQGNVNNDVIELSRVERRPSQRH